MNGNLVDTNVIIKLLSGDENAVRLFYDAKEIAVPVIVAGELFYGACKSSRAEENFNLFTFFQYRRTTIAIITFQFAKDTKRNKAARRFLLIPLYWRKDHCILSKSAYPPSAAVF